MRQRGLKTALLTNWDSRVRQVLTENGYERYFDHLFISSEIGHEKPDREIFRFASEALELAPQEIMHVGDSLQHDVRGALNAGWRAVRITATNGSEQRGEMEIAALSDLLEQGALMP